MLRTLISHCDRCNLDPRSASARRSCSGKVASLDSRQASQPRSALIALMNDAQRSIEASATLAAQPASGAARAILVANVPAGGFVQYTLGGSERARALRDECVSWLSPRAASYLPTLDSATRRWLRRSKSPYVSEIEAIAASLGYPGIWFLNGSYE